MTMRGMAGLTLLALLSTISLAPARAAAPSFDCAKAGNWAEKEICKSDDLAALDAWFAPLYGQVAQRLAGKDLDALKAHRKAWVKARNDCKADASLADVEAKAGDAAAQRDQADQNAHLTDRLAEANVAWRAYRNTECKRRQQGGGD